MEENCDVNGVFFSFFFKKKVCNDLRNDLIKRQFQVCCAVIKPEQLFTVQPSQNKQFLYFAYQALSVL
eukprot:c30993_g1_i1 orf=100-303(-)